ncbi:MAG TPA: flagellar basal body rod protein FlgC [Bacteroidota bacterium]|nr:flagellar basal body rod protein FlgC [Bacteroidota bacterium]
MKIGKLFAGFDISAMGLTAQRKRMNAIADNMANAETTRTDAGGPYKRKIVLMKAEADQSFSSTLNSMDLKLAATNEQHFSTVSAGTTNVENLGGGVDSTEKEDTSPFKMVYDPGNPDADGDGYVKMPNVNVVTEMVDMMSASRSYEANVTALNAAKASAKDALEI